MEKQRNMKILRRFLLIAVLLVPQVHSESEEEFDVLEFRAGVLGFGDTCNSTLPCNETLWLNCSSAGKCECLEGMVNFDLSLPCVSKIGSPCQTATANPKLCIENALCMSDYNCACETGYLADPNNEKCLLGFEAECSRHSDCNFDALLKCRDQVCVCESGQIWDRIELRCRSTVGNFCDERNTTILQITCVENAACDATDHTCYCEDTFEETPSKECKLAYNQTCTTNTQCHPNFKCNVITEATTKSCTCDAVNQEYDEVYGVCNNLVGKPCNIDTNPNCVANSLCSTKTNTCTCQVEFEPSANGKCVLDYAGDCSSGPEICKTESNLECNTVEKRCQCKADYVYSMAQYKCLGMSGANCTLHEDCYDLTTCGTTSKKCECKAGYTETPEDSCLLAHGSKCQAPSSCNPFNFLLCSVATQSCDCESPDMIFDGVNSCVSKAEGTCFINEVGARKLGCIANSTCTTNTGSGSASFGKCQCNEGFDKNSETGLCGPKNSVERVLIYSGLWIVIGAIFLVL